MGKFIFQEMTLGGMPRGEPVTVSTATGLLLQCPHKINLQHVERMAEIARQTPDYPCDISLFEGPEENRNLVWNARIYWSNAHG